MERARPLVPGAGAVLGTGLAAMAILASAWLVLASSTPSEAWSTLTIVPALVLASIPALRRQGVREGDRALFWFLLLVLVLKLCGAVARYYVAFDVYEGGDAERYHEWGVALSRRFSVGDFDTGFGLTGTDFIGVLTGAVYTIIGPNKLGGFLLFSWLGFWGLFLFYRAFALAFPDGRRRMYATFLFLLPSLIFWPSSIGKEAWMTFALGLAVFGAARALSGSQIRGVAIAILGLWLAAVVRPHIAGILAVAFAAAYLVRRPRRELRHLAPFAKVVSLAALVVIALFFVGGAERFLQQSGIDTEGGVTSVLEQTTERTGKGGSEFTPSVLESPGRAPIAAITVLFRPFVDEAHNAQTLFAALEASLLLLLSALRIRWILSSLGAVRRRPFLAIVFAYVALFVLAFSGVANFGILVRQRVQLMPLYLVLLAVPPMGRTEAAAAPSGKKAHPLASKIANE